MSRRQTNFRSLAGEAAFMAVYDTAMTSWPVPFEPMDIAGPYGTTHLVACGPKDAPALALLHGFSVNLTMWSANIADLSRDYRVHVIDVMGQPGKSVCDRPLKRRADCVAWLTGILDALDIKHVHLVGASYGGWLTLNYAIAAPDRVATIVLLAPAGCFVSLALQLYLRAVLLFVVRTRAVAERFVRWFAYAENLRDLETRAIFDSIVELMYLGARHFPLQQVARPGAFSDDELRGVRVPTLLLLGEQEVICDPAAALARARRLVPGLEGELVPRSSHDMSISRHAQVDARILEFLGRRAAQPVAPAHEGP